MPVDIDARAARVAGSLLEQAALVAEASVGEVDADGIGGLGVVGFAVVGSGGARE